MGAVAPMATYAPSTHSVRGRNADWPSSFPSRFDQHFFSIPAMTKKLQITIEGDNLDKTHEGDWTISLTLDGVLASQSGLSGRPIDAIATAHDLAIAKGLVEDPNE